MAEEKRVLDPHFVELAKAFSYGDDSDETGNRLLYRLYRPTVEAGKVYPLVVFLHGAGERGYDNELQVAGNRGAVVWTEAEEQAKRPCFVLAPQAEPEKNFTVPEFEAAFLAFLETFMAENPVDRDRVYLTGLSMGGMGTWYYACRYPTLWAAAAPICGAGGIEALENAKKIPMWTFHAVDDPMVPIDGKLERDGTVRYGTRILADRLRALGGNVRSTEYPAGYIHRFFGYPEAFAGHASWEPAYASEDFRAWLFRQKR